MSVIVAFFCQAPMAHAERDVFKALGVKKLEAGSPLGSFALPDVDGGVRQLSDWSDKLVLLNFWATWCSPCLVEMPALNRLHEKYKAQGFAVLAVNTDPKETKRIDTVIDRLNLQFPVLLDIDGKLHDQFKVSGMPVSYLINSQNRVVGYVAGARGWDSPDAHRLIESLLPAEE